MLDAVFFTLLIVALGLLTAKVAQDRGVKGSLILWFIGGALLFVLVLPLALMIKIDPQKAGKEDKRGP